MCRIAKELSNTGATKYPLAVRNYTLKFIDFIVKESRLQKLTRASTRDVLIEDLETITLNFMRCAKQAFVQCKGKEPRLAVRAVYQSATSIKKLRSDEVIEVKTKYGDSYFVDASNFGRYPKWAEEIYDGFQNCGSGDKAWVAKRLYRCK